MAFWQRKEIIVLLLAACAVSSAIKCQKTEHLCDEKRCIPKTWTCDGYTDCQDSYDESAELCGRTCSDIKFQCDSLKCIPKVWKCDGQDDCGDGSDERDCPKQCSPFEFQCHDGQCVDLRVVCNDETDCIDGTDEGNCTQKNETQTGFRCKSGLNIPLSWLCDGQFDCLDGSDESNCPGSQKAEESRCKDTEFDCTVDSFCIPVRWQCDGHADCPNAKDEAECGKCNAAQFQCGDGECIQGHLRCNGAPDCSDASDENNCSMKLQTSGCNVEDKFWCGRNASGADIWLPCNKTCDKVNDCGDWQDEAEQFCGRNECDTADHGGCSQLCVDTKEGYHCACHPGYKLIGRFTCIDVNECEDMPGICSQTCTNTLGSFHCSCIPGYAVDPSNNTRCKVEDGIPYLIFSHGYDIRRMSLRDHELQIITEDTLGAMAIDYFFDEHQLLWSDRKKKKVYKAKLANAEETKSELLEDELISADGLAVDWIHRNVYYTETATDEIHMISWDFNWKKTIVADKLERPRAIVVSPTHGYIFWSDWGTTPKIERATLDGTNREVIVEGDETVWWPNGLTIDYTNNRLYWCDGKFHRIMSSNLDGSDVRTILYNTTLLSHPYSIAVFEDRVYWSDWTQRAIYNADKFTGADITSIPVGFLVGVPNVLQVYHRDKQGLKDNACKVQQISCSHFCVTAPSGDPKCVCPDKMHLDSEGSSCVFHSNFSGINENIYAPRYQAQNSQGNGISQQGEPLSITIQTNVTGKTDTVLVVGITVAVVALLLLVTGLYIGHTKLKKRPIPGMRFSNSIYGNTTDIIDGGGFTIAQEDILFETGAFNKSEKFFNKSKGFFNKSKFLRDADDAPLSPDEDDGLS